GTVAQRDQRLHDDRPNPTGDDRTPAQRDRDRVLYSSAFRRLAEVTQVVSANSGYVFHNRLTHSLQVAQVGRRLAEKLVLKQPSLAKDVVNPDVVEAACLAHDLGHPPFGHVAEHALNELTKNTGGFEGNAQSFRIVTTLASRRSAYSGLDLTRATLAAILKYPWFRLENPDKKNKWGAYETERPSFEHAQHLMPGKFERTVEATIMDWADDITYSVHDVEDFYRAGRMPIHLLAVSEKQSPEREYFFRTVFERNASDPEFASREMLQVAFTEAIAPYFRIKTAYNGSAAHRAALRDFTGVLIGRYINGATLREHDGKIQLYIDAGPKAEVQMLKQLTWTYVIEASGLASQQHGQRRVVQELFEVFRESASAPSRWNIFPQFFKERLKRAEEDPAETIRTCLDLIASMTESQAIAMHGRLTGKSHASSLLDLMH
ncbi:MAG: dNTP triphosphohydrolase, partial [Terriglobia bacterium]|nr:dNTP triphosphohydrolase [Terriglobia bacterium]